MTSAHAAVKHELLVRCLDAWLPLAVHGHRRVAYVDAGEEGSALAAARVFAEFPDLLAGHPVTMVLCGPALDGFAPPAGLTVRTAVPAADMVFAYAGAPDSSDSLLSSLRMPADLLLTVSPVDGAQWRSRLLSVGLTARALVELVDGAGAVELLAFATGSDKALARFKDDLWALDEYAGIRYRDPADPEHTPLDISLQPNLRPLRRALAGRLQAAGPLPLADLRAWTLHETIYRAEDATRAVHALLDAGEATRQPSGGRLAPATMITAT